MPKIVYIKKEGYAKVFKGQFDPEILTNIPDDLRMIVQDDKSVELSGLNYPLWNGPKHSYYPLKTLSLNTTNAVARIEEIYHLDNVRRNFVYAGHLGKAKELDDESDEEDIYRGLLTATLKGAAKSLFGFGASSTKDDYAEMVEASESRRMQEYEENNSYADLLCKIWSSLLQIVTPHLDAEALAAAQQELPYSVFYNFYLKIPNFAKLYKKSPSLARIAFLCVAPLFDNPDEELRSYYAGGDALLSELGLITSIRLNNNEDLNEFFALGQELICFKINQWLPHIVKLQNYTNTGARGAKPISSTDITPAFENWLLNSFAPGAFLNYSLNPYLGYSSGAPSALNEVLKIQIQLKKTPKITSSITVSATATPEEKQLLNLSLKVNPVLAKILGQDTKKGLAEIDNFANKYLNIPSSISDRYGRDMREYTREATLKQVGRWLKTPEAKNWLKTTPNVTEVKLLKKYARNIIGDGENLAKRNLAEYSLWKKYQGGIKKSTKVTEPLVVPEKCKEYQSGSVTFKHLDNLKDFLKAYYYPYSTQPRQQFAETLKPQEIEQILESKLIYYQIFQDKQWVGVVGFKSTGKYFLWRNIGVPYDDGSVLSDLYCFGESLQAEIRKSSKSQITL